MKVFKEDDSMRPLVDQSRDSEFLGKVHASANTEEIVPEFVELVQYTVQFISISMHP